MSTILPNTITPSNLIDYSRWTIDDTSVVETEQELRVLEASSDIINFALRRFEWRCYKTALDNHTQIGYNTINDKINGVGLLESEAYSEWLEDFKTTERKFKRLISIKTLSQSQYDALLCLYYFTGDFTKVGTTARTFDLTKWIIDKKWDYIASALIESGYNRLLTQPIATIMMLGDYGSRTERALLRERGLQILRKEYPALTDKVARQQAEYIYYAETKRFLPNLTQARKRQIVTIANKL
tara:strand:- start:6746 stop:7468 length:723 start_codon:yes stop_codon:yes gene_type:complete